MIKIHKPEAIVSNGAATPVMPQHHLTPKKDAHGFIKDQTVACYISMYTGGRYAVWACDWTNRIVPYHVFSSESDLNDHFDEILP